MRDRKSGDERELCAPLVISNIGPEATSRLTGMNGQPDIREEAPDGKRVASGLKVHLLSDDSIIPHKGIMYCLDTQRIAGIVQPSNSDRRLAPPGKHLLITHQLMRSDNVNAEREAARADLRYLFGDAFGTRVEYPDDEPVSRRVAGQPRAAGRGCDPADGSLWSLFGR